MARRSQRFHPADLQPIAFGVVAALSLFGAVALWAGALMLLFMQDDFAAGRIGPAMYLANLSFVAGPAIGAVLGWVLYAFQRYVAALAVSAPLLLMALVTFAWIAGG